MKNIISIIVILISLASFIFFVKPEFTQVKALEAKSKEYEEILKNARKLRKIRDQLLEKRQSFSEKDLQRLEKLIPDNADNVKLIIDLQNIAKNYGLSIETASSQKDEKGKKKKKQKQSFDIESKDYGIISLSFSAKGSYEGFLSFLKDLEDKLRITDVRGLSIEPLEKNQDYQFSIDVDTYWLKDNI